jgi:hypothetical protein
MDTETNNKCENISFFIRTRIILPIQELTFLQSSFVFLDSPGRFAILHSTLDVGNAELAAAVAAAAAAAELQPVVVVFVAAQEPGVAAVDN